MELPLLKRELIELAQRRRTYALRCLVWLVLFTVFLISFLDSTYYASNILQVLGKGKTISDVLFVSLMVTIFALNPAMACSAITSEKEKQTLGLLIVSKLTPAGIVAEKITSHMVPLVTLLLTATPLFAVAYLFGGVTFVDSMSGLFILFCAILQVTTVAVFCSALLESGFAAFWATYIVLAVIYFTLPIMRALDLIRLDFGSLPDEEFLFFPLFQMIMLVTGMGSVTETLLMTIPSLIVTAVFAVAARFAVLYYSFGSAFSFGKRMQAVKGTVVARLRDILGDRDESPPAADALRPDHNTVVSHQLWTGQPIAWRELRGTIVSSWKVQAVIIAGLCFLTMAMMGEWPHDGEEISALMSMGGMIVAVLLVLGLSCRLFATERERQTLDSLLTTPLTNRELLNQKLAGINRLILALVVLFFLFGILNLFGTDVRHTGVRSESILRGGPVSYYQRNVVQPGSSAWFQVAFHFLPGVVGCAFIYLHLAKWTAVYWGLKLNTQMKALLASILSILALALIPMLLTVACLISIHSNPDEFPLFCFTSPGIILAFNEIHELDNVYRRSWFPTSDWLVILTNIAIYGGLTLALRRFVRRQVPVLLNRPERLFPGCERGGRSC